MKVILKEDVPNLGKLGDMVEVKPGYGRNYLIPHGKAISATEGNMRRLDHEKRLVAEYASKLKHNAESVAAKIESMSVTIAAQAGAEERLFGSITNRDIEEALREQGIDIDRKNILLDDPIKKLGIYTVSVKLGMSVDAQLKVWVVGK